MSPEELLIEPVQGGIVGVRGDGFRPHQRLQLLGTGSAALEEMGDDLPALLARGGPGCEPLQGFCRRMFHWMSFPVTRFIELSIKGDRRRTSISGRSHWHE